MIVEAGPQMKHQYPLPMLCECFERKVGKNVRARGRRENGEELGLTGMAQTWMERPKLHRGCDYMHNTGLHQEPVSKQKELMGGFAHR